MSIIQASIFLYFSNIKLMAYFTSIYCIIFLIRTLSIQMDKSFNFFKSKPKKENERPRPNSKSNSSKGSYTRNADKMKTTINKVQTISKK